MNERYRAELNRLFLHADISVALRQPASGELPAWTLKGDACLNSAAALLIAGVEVLAILVLEGATTRSHAVGILDALHAGTDERWAPSAPVRRGTPDVAPRLWMPRRGVREQELV